MHRWHFVIEGLPPGVIMNNPQQILHGSSKGMHPVEEARLGLFVNEAGELYAPIEWIRNMVLFGAKGRKWGKRSVVDELSAGLLINLDSKHVGFVFTRDGKPVRDNCPKPDSKGKIVAAKPDWEVFTVPAKIPPKRGAMVHKSRARIFAPWQLECHFDIYDGAETLAGFIRKGKGDELALELGDKVVSVAGTICGLGSWAPRQRGWHGRFRLIRSWIDEIEAQPEKKRNAG